MSGSKCYSRSVSLAPKHKTVDILCSKSPIGRISGTPPQACTLLCNQPMRMWKELKKLDVALNLRDDLCNGV